MSRLELTKGENMLLFVQSKSVDSKLVKLETSRALTLSPMVSNLWASFPENLCAQMLAMLISENDVFSPGTCCWNFSSCSPLAPDPGVQAEKQQLLASPGHRRTTVSDHIYLISPTTQHWQWTNLILTYSDCNLLPISLAICLLCCNNKPNNTTLTMDQSYTHITIVNYFSLGLFIKLYGSVNYRFVITVKIFD